MQQNFEPMKCVNSSGTRTSQNSVTYVTERSRGRTSKSHMPSSHMRRTTCVTLQVPETHLGDSLRSVRLEVCVMCSRKISKSGGRGLRRNVPLRTRQHLVSDHGPTDRSGGAHSKAPKERLGLWFGDWSWRLSESPCRGCGVRSYLAENRYTVVERKRSPAFSKVKGKCEWCGESGKC